MLVVAVDGSGTYALVDGLHQVLKVREYVGVGLVAMFGHNGAVYDHIELAVGTGGQLEHGDVLSGLA